VAKRYVLEQKLLLTAYRKSRKPLEIEAWFQRSTNRKWHMGYQMVTWPMTSCDPQRCREEVRSAILATAWLLVCYRAFEVEPAPSPRRWTHNKTRRPECIFQQLTTGYDVSAFFTVCKLMQHLHASTLAHLELLATNIASQLPSKQKPPSWTRLPPPNSNKSNANLQSEAFPQSNCHLNVFKYKCALFCAPR